MVQKRQFVRGAGLFHHKSIKDLNKDYVEIYQISEICNLPVNLQVSIMIDKLYFYFYNFPTKNKEK